MRSVARRAALLAFVLPCLATPAGAAEPPASVDSAAAWIERMLAAQRLGDTLAARIRAHTADHTKSERDVVIELLRTTTSRAFPRPSRILPRATSPRRPSAG